MLLFFLSTNSFGSEQERLRYKYLFKVSGLQALLEPGLKMQMENYPTETEEERRFKRCIESKISKKAYEEIFVSSLMEVFDAVAAEEIIKFFETDIGQIVSASTSKNETPDFESDSDYYSYIEFEKRYMGLTKLKKFRVVVEKKLNKYQF